MRAHQRDAQAKSRGRPTVSSLKFRDRLQEFFYYPKLSREEDSITDVPRFTSYLDLPADDRPVLVYLHIPFCDYLCHFCPFLKTLNQSTSRMEKELFFDALVTEIRRYGRSEFFDGRAVEWVEFGGGTPTSVEPEFIEAVFTALRESFDLSGNPLITMEGDALTLKDEAKLRTFRDLGVNRVSFGVQTFKGDLRRKLGLKPTPADIRAAVSEIRRAGIPEFAIDLLYNLPDQTMDTLRDDIAQGCSLEPDYIDTYALTLWENTWFKRTVEESDRFSLKPSNERNIRMFEVMRDSLRERGYDAEHSYMFARRGVPHRYVDQVKGHLLGGGHILGLGPSSRGYVAGRQYVNTSSIGGYVSALQGGTLPISAGTECSPLEQAHRLMVMFPSLLQEIEVGSIPHPELFAADIARMKTAGLLIEEDGLLKTTDTGMTWAGNVSRIFFSADQKAKMTRTHLLSLRERLNPYNQDSAGVPGR
ncbi:radical SAM protein [Actinocorallia sp. B10E7]|uniref:coproporphyrinogen-III oxidase family protein n=1 Tax=Actinocorallia sp. B10E7 TaxID=3153558 RepID=UPI00325CF3B3